MSWIVKQVKKNDVFQTLLFSSLYTHFNYTLQYSHLPSTLCQNELPSPHCRSAHTCCFLQCSVSQQVYFRL